MSAAAITGEQIASLGATLEALHAACRHGSSCGRPGRPGVVFLKVALGRCRPHTRSGRACPCAPSATWAPRGHGAIAVCPC